MENFKKLKLTGKAVVYVDWANVYGWRKSLKAEIDNIRLYHGKDIHPKSAEFLKTARLIRLRKCDFRYGGLY
jgi:hypothetical protein